VIKPVTIISFPTHKISWINAPTCIDPGGFYLPEITAELYVDDWLDVEDKRS